MDTNQEQWKIRYQKKRRRNRGKRIINTISVAGMLSLSIYLCLAQGGSSKVGAKAANAHNIETIEQGNYNQDYEDASSNLPNQSLSETQKEEASKTEKAAPIDTVEEEIKEAVLDEGDTKKEGMDKEEANDKEETKAELEKEEAEDDFFKDTIFIGDSRTEGLGQFGGVENAKFYTYRGLMVNTAIVKNYISLDIKQKGNVLDAARQTSFSKVYLMFGINELGWNSLTIFIEDYRNIVEGLREIEPDCEIIIQANYPVTKKMNEGDTVFNNTNIKKFNDLIKRMADEENVTYVDLYSFFANEDGNLPDKATSDGIHLNPSYFKKWKQCLIDFGSGNTER